MLVIYRLSLVLLLVATLHQNTFCQNGEKLTYRTHIKDSLNTGLINAHLLVKLIIIDNNNQTIYCEKHDDYTDSTGMLTLHIGEGSAIQGDLNKVYLYKGTCFIVLQNDTTAVDIQTSFISIHEIFRMHYPIHNAGDSFYLGKYFSNGKLVYMYLSEKLNRIDTIKDTLDNVISEGKDSLIILPDIKKAKNKTQKQLNVHELPEGWYIPTIDDVPLLFYQRFTPNVKKQKQRFTFTMLYYVVKDFNVSYVKLLPPPSKW